VSDDGSGVDLDKVRARAVELGLLSKDEPAAAEGLEALLFQPGFTTARTVTEVAGRGIGLDVVKSELAAIGGRVRLETEPGQGTRFIIRLPLTLALTPVVLARAGGQVFALPANLVAEVREVTLEELQPLQEAGAVEHEAERYPLRALSELTDRNPEPGEARVRTVLLVRSGKERLALQVDALEGNYEAVVKNTGAQLARISGVVGATVLGDGRIALILNPFSLAERAPRSPQMLEVLGLEQEQPALILVVDDSLTVRKITNRLLTREGYRVATAKDGLEAMEFMREEVPTVILLDIEMPRMDGFEVTRAVRADGRLKNVPIVMITSRTAEKHREHALDLGVDMYMGKPYQEEELLEAIARLTGQAVAA
jgi:chemosensory pili system protein ChpA (sensor histidine kinase/response regulator)